MEIAKGTMEDLEEVAQLYDETADFLERHVNYPGWRKGLYPVRENASEAIEEGSLYVAREGNKLVGSFILRQEPEDAFPKMDWGVELEHREVFVVYTFAVHPDHQKRGIGRAMLDYILQLAQENGIKAVRLDVYEKNLPAISLYKKCGFQYIGTADLGLGQIGLDQFELYQWRNHG